MGGRIQGSFLFSSLRFDLQIDANMVGALIFLFSSLRFSGELKMVYSAGSNTPLSILFFEIHGS